MHVHSEVTEHCKKLVFMQVNCFPKILLTVLDERLAANILIGINHTFLGD